MNNRLILTFILLASCSNSTPSGTTDSGTVDAHTSQTDTAVAAIDAPASTDVSPPAVDARASADVSINPNGFDDRGCLTYAAASPICGSSTSAFCAAFARCNIPAGMPTTASNCSINCTMATTVYCQSPAKVQACSAAVANADCAAMQTECMGWINF